MSTDLDRMFNALRQDADAIPLTEAISARRRGERRRRTQLVATAVAVVCAVVAGLAGGSWLTRDLAGPEPEPVAPPDRVVELGPPRPLNEEIAFGGRPEFALTALGGDRVYASWFAGDQLTVAAADLETGRPVWPPRALGEFDDSNGIVALPTRCWRSASTTTVRSRTSCCSSSTRTVVRCAGSFRSASTTTTCCSSRRRRCW
ncbi:hypothetical protein ACFQ1L_43310 [Phytohabitans flavus]|uniref:hypothetical protein n=1 Tax=Phytohabitans flavus TaxID=1076124 RepID=UPI0036293E8A